jgi:recombination protein RecR
LAEPFSRLANLLSRLPGVGRKTAQRLSYFILTSEEAFAAELADAIREARASAKVCSVCFNLSDADPCEICSNPLRDPTAILVVEDAKDLAAIERAKGYRGLYHVLGGAISPMAGVKPQDLRIAELMARIGAEVKEVILATGLSVEGETTASYIARALAPLGVKSTRLARGIPTGAELEYTDAATLNSAIDGRKPL